MSLLGQIYATPSRLKGVVQYFAAVERRPLKRSTVENMLSPKSLPGNRGGDRLMIAAVLDECIDLGLLDGEEPEGTRSGARLRKPDALLHLAKGWKNTFSSPAQVGERLPGVIRDLVFAEENSVNEDLASAIAWYLTQDVLTAPGEWEAFGAALVAAGLRNAFRFNDNKFQMLSYWAPYLGFANSCALPTPGNVLGREWMAPDPTACLRDLLGEVLTARGGVARLAACMDAVAARCPTFEGGALRTRLEAHAPSRPPTHLSSTTSHALLRLQEERAISLELRHDADARVLVDGGATRSYSDIRWLGAARRAA